MQNFRCKKHFTKTLNVIVPNCINLLYVLIVFNVMKVSGNMFFYPESRYFYSKFLCVIVLTSIRYSFKILLPLIVPCILDLQCTMVVKCESRISILVPRIWTYEGSLKMTGSRLYFKFMQSSVTRIMTCHNLFDISKQIKGDILVH